MQKFLKSNYAFLFVASALLLLLQACSYSNYSYRVRPAESFHEECGYAFTCVMFSKTSLENRASLLVTIGMTDNSKSKILALNGIESCKSLNEIDSVSLGFAETNEIFKSLKSSNRYEYQFQMPSVNGSLKQHKKLVLKIYFKGETAPKLFFLKKHEEQTPRALFGSC